MDSRDCPQHGADALSELAMQLETACHAGDFQDRFNRRLDSQDTLTAALQQELEENHTMKEGS